MDKLHLFDGDISVAELPQRFNNPFSYRPHPLCVRASEKVRRLINGDASLRDEAASGKMFGVLVVRDKVGRVGFLAAFSGLMGGSNSHEYFVPPVFDFLSPAGYFKLEEYEISLINKEISTITNSVEYIEALGELQSATNERDEFLSAERTAIQQAKALREKRRSSGKLSGEELEKLEFADVRGTEGIKEATYTIAGKEIKVCAASGLKNAQAVMEKVKAGTADYQFIEIMACPGGCVNGGGQPVQPASVHNFVDLKGIRGKALYEADANLPVRKSHENEAVKAVYAEYFEKPGSHVAHEVLHTHYVKRGKYSK
jgi:hypothetical protein